MSTLARLEAHYAKREWLQLHREAARLLMMESLTDRERARVYRAWGRARAGLNQPHGAIEILNKAIPLALQVKDWDCLGYVRADLGSLYTTVGDIDLGVNSLLAYLLDFERYDAAREMYGKVHYNLALAFKYQRKYTQAAGCYEEAINWFTLRGDALMKAMSHQNLSWLYCTLGETATARQHLEVADTFREVLSPAYDAEQLCCWALYHWTVGAVGDAVDYVQEVLLAKRQGVDAHHRGQAAAIGGNIAVLLGQEKWARQLLDLATACAVEAEDPPLGGQCSELRRAIQKRFGGAHEAAH